MPTMKRKTETGWQVVTQPLLDNVPVQGSTRGVTSGGVYDAIQGGGLPTPSEANSGVVYNGTAWIATTGYGRRIPGTAYFEWDGDTTGKPSISLDGQIAYKILDNPNISSTEIIGKTITFLMKNGSVIEVADEFTVRSENIVSAASGSQSYIVSLDDIPFLFYVYEDSLYIESVEQTFTKGVWALNLQEGSLNYFCSFLGIKDQYITFDSKYLPNYDKKIENGARLSDSVAILTTDTSHPNLVAIGSESSGASASVSIGSKATSRATGVSIGYQSEVSSDYGISIGCYSKATASNAVQLGQGTNNNSDSLQFKNTQIINANGEMTAPMEYTTTVPTSANTNGVKIALLDSVPSTRYNGWLYLIKE